MIRRLESQTSRRQFIRRSLAVAAALPLASRTAWAQQRQVNIYNWDTYIGETTLADFTDATGIATRYDLYADNAELFARLREGNPGYDIIVPTNDWAERKIRAPISGVVSQRMIRAGMVQQLDLARITNFDNLAPRFRDAPFDPGRQRTIPYLWGTIGIGYRTSRVETVPDSWGFVFDRSAPYAGRISWLAEPSTVIQMALKYLGYSLQSTDMGELGQAVEVLIRSKPNIRTIAGDNGQDLLVAREVDLAMEWNGDILQVMQEDEDLAFVNPREGGLIWQDVMAIPTGAPHRDEAHEFINFILQPEVHAGIGRVTRYALPNAAALALMPEDYRRNPAIFPPDEVLERGEVSKYLGEEISRFYDEAMTRVRAA